MSNEGKKDNESVSTNVDSKRYDQKDTAAFKYKMVLHWDLYNRINALVKHYNDIRGNVNSDEYKGVLTEVQQHKHNVLTAALELIQEASKGSLYDDRYYVDETEESRYRVKEGSEEKLQKKYDEFHLAIANNPKYNQSSMFTNSETESLVYKTVQLAALRVDTPLTKDGLVNRANNTLLLSETKMNRHMLLIDLQSHLNGMMDKRDDKHDAKRTVLQAAIKALKSGDSKDFTAFENAVNNPKNKDYKAAFFVSITDTLVKQTLVVAEQMRNEAKTGLVEKQTENYTFKPR